MVDYTKPVTATLEWQRQSIKRGQEAIEQGIGFQQRIGEAFVAGVERQKSPQQRTVEQQQAMAHNVLDVVEANVPATAGTVEEARETIDEQYEELLAIHEESFEDVAEGLDQGIDVYDEVTAEYVEALDEQVDLLLETHEEIEAQSVEAVEELDDQIAELQDQIEEVGDELQDASEQAVEA